MSSDNKQSSCIVTQGFRNSHDKLQKMCSFIFNSVTGRSPAVSPSVDQLYSEGISRAGMSILFIFYTDLTPMLAAQLTAPP